MVFRRKAKTDPADATRRLREQALTVPATELGLTATPARPHVWGVLMETAYPDAVATLVVLAEGTTSLYFSNGGGIIGAGEHQAVRAAGEVLLSAAEAHLTRFAPTTGTPLLDVGMVRFYVRTFTGTLTAQAPENDLGEGRHPLSPVFLSGHDVITAIRESTPEV